MLRVHMYVHRRKKTSCVLTHYSTPYSFKTGSLAEPRVRSATLATLLFLSIFHSTGTSAGAWALSDFLRGCWRFSLWSSCLHTKCFHLLTYLYILSHLEVSHLTDTGEKVGPIHKSAPIFSASGYQMFSVPFYPNLFLLFIIKCILPSQTYFP